MPNPSTIAELFQFYYDFVKPLYGSVQLQNELPAECLFEINAAFDHLSRHWQYGEPEDVTVEKAYSHLKRSCLDIFKLRVKEARRQYDELRKVDISLIDNGQFHLKLIALWNKITAGAENARLKEGNTAADAVTAFDLWNPVYADCVTLDKDFYSNPNVTWAEIREQRSKWAERGWGFAIGLITGIAAIWICDGLKNAVPTAPTPTTRQSILSGPSSPTQPT